MRHVLDVLDLLLQLGLKRLLTLRVQDVDAADDLQLGRLGPLRRLRAQRPVCEGGDGGKGVGRRIAVEDLVGDGPSRDATGTYTPLASWNLGWGKHGLLRTKDEGVVGRHVGFWSLLSTRLVTGRDRNDTMQLGSEKICYRLRCRQAMTGTSLSDLMYSSHVCEGYAQNIKRPTGGSPLGPHLDPGHLHGMLELNHRARIDALP